MARVLALCGDLMFGSRIAAQLQAAGEELELLPDAASVRARLRGQRQEHPRLLIVDLTSDSEQGIGLVAGLVEERRAGRRQAGRERRRAGRALRRRSPHARLLLPRRGGRARARRGAGFDLVVPRSRMAREGASLVGRLLEDPPSSSGSR